MIKICTSLSKDYDVSLWGRKKSNVSTSQRSFKQVRISFKINKGPLFYLLYNLKVFFKLLVAKVDIIHSVDLDTLPAGYLVAKLRKKKLVYDSHEYFTEVPELLNRPSKRNLWLKIEESIVPKLKNAMTVGELIAEEYTKKYKVPFGVVRNAPVLSDLNEVNPKTKYLLYQGALNKGRGLEALIEAMKNIPIQLKIAGTGDLDKELQNLAMLHQVEDKVEFLGMIEPAKLPEITANAFAGINVSENLGLSYYYSLNNKYFDYIHSGLPAITNPFPEYKRLNEKYECSVFANAVSNEIEHAVNLLLNDSSLYDELRKNCLIARQELNWNIEEEKLLKFYAESI